MITTLPIARPALAGEPGFSVLARNTNSNASSTTAEFCGAVGISKAAICAGNPADLEKLANLTGSDAGNMRAHSPLYEGRKFANLNGQKLLSRSIRKAELAVCPACWEQDMAVARHQLHIRSCWLPKPICTCAKHNLLLIELPYSDYTSCYDHFRRAGLKPAWLQRLPELQAQQQPSDFERAALALFNEAKPVFPWLGEVQMDVLGHWCLGLGLLLERGATPPSALNLHERRHLTNIGYKAMAKGRLGLDVEIDGALTRHRVRLSATWVHNWATQASKFPERRAVRDIMAEMCSDQGRYHLLSVASASAEQHFVNAEIAHLAQRTRRSKAWVRTALQRERLLPESGLPKTRDISVHMRRCRNYIFDVVDSLDTTKSAARLNIGIKGFEALVEDGVLRRMRNRSHKKRRFVRSELDHLGKLIDQNAARQVSVLPANYCSIPEACFQLGPTTAQVTRLLIGGQLPSSVRLEGLSGFAAVRINRAELKTAMKIFTDEHIGPRELTRRLGLSFGELKILRERQVLPSFPAPKGHPRRSVKYISTIVLRRFLGKFQTVRTAARELGVTEAEMRAKLRRGNIVYAPEGGDVPIFRRADLID